MKPFWVTFYSYKGGVGRTLALANLAALLVQRGRRVVLIDFDLEAPGLDSFGEFAKTAAKPGVVEYVSEFTLRKVAPDIRDFVHACILPTPLRGPLWIMPAGRQDGTYRQLLSRLDWVKLYKSGLGTPFVENWKAAINEKFRPDFVLVDSRTGLTEIGGVSTTQFPDLVTMLFALNEQNVHGVARVTNAIRDAYPDRLPQFHYVATPVPNMTPDKRSELAVRLKAASRHLGVTIDSTIRYYSPAALGEKLFVLSEVSPKPQIISDYQALLEKIIEFNRNGIDFLGKQVSDALKEGDQARLGRLSAVVKRDFSFDSEGQFLLSQIALSQGEMQDSIIYAEEAVHLDPAHRAAFEFLNSHYTRTHESDKLIALCEDVLERGESLNEMQRIDVYQRLGRAQMNIGRYSAAADSFRNCFSWARDRKAVPNIITSFGFNYAEALRRAGNREHWVVGKEIIEGLKNSTFFSEKSLPIQANRWQAAHILFALNCDLPAALDALRKAQRAAKTVGEAEDIFTVKSYEEVSVQEFLRINDDMASALERGELWDGTHLDTSVQSAKVIIDS